MTMENVKAICKSLADKKAMDIKIISLEGMSDVADYFVVASGNSVPQVKAMFDNLEETMEKQGIFALKFEGVQEGRWIAVDYGDVIVHIFHKEAREMYKLDSLWNNFNNIIDYKD